MGLENDKSQCRSKMYLLLREYLLLILTSSKTTSAKETKSDKVEKQHGQSQVV